MNANRSLLQNYVIWHISDVHIRAGVYDDIIYAVEQLAAKIRSEIIPIDQQLVVIVGDIFELKSYVYTGDFICFDKILNILRDINVIIIPGNHDFDKTSEIDLVSIALRFSTNPKIHLFTKSEIRRIPGFNLNFHVVNPMTKQFPEPNPDLPKCYNIIILHDQIQGCTLCGTHSVQNSKFTITNLDRYDLVLAGDIHKYQIFGRRKNMAYSGSLIQKHKGEDLQHGVIRWTVNDKILPQFIPFQLRTAYLKITAINNTMELPESQLYKNIKYVEFNHSLCSPEKVNEFIQTLTEKYKYVNKIYNTDIPANVDGISATDISPEVQTNLLREELKGDPFLDRIITIHEELMKNSHGIKHKWCLQFLYWSNVFCYGEDNFIDFTRLSGINSIIGNNMVGKSSIIDILTQVLYNRALRADARGINRWGTDLSRIVCKFRVGNDQYIITRECKTGKNPTVKLLKCVETDNKWSDISGGTIPKTYNLIRELIGTEDDLLNLNIAIQDNVRIMDRPEKDQISIFHRYFELDKFEYLGTEVKKRLRDINTKLEVRKADAEKYKIDATIPKLQDNITEVGKQIGTLKAKRKVFQTEKDKLNRKLNPELLGENIDNIKSQLDGIDLSINVRDSPGPSYFSELRERASILRVEITELQKKLIPLYCLGTESTDGLVDSVPPPQPPPSINIADLVERTNILQKGIKPIPPHQSEITEKICDTGEIARIVGELANLTSVATKYTVADLDRIDGKYNSEEYRNWQQKHGELALSEERLRKYSKLQSSLSEGEVYTAASAITETEEELVVAGFSKTFDPTKKYDVPKRPRQSREELETMRKQLLDEKLLDKLQYNSQCECCQHNSSLRKPKVDLDLKSIGESLKLLSIWEVYDRNISIQRKLQIFNDRKFYERRDIISAQSKLRELLAHYQPSHEIFAEKSQILVNEQIRSLRERHKFLVHANRNFHNGEAARANERINQQILEIQNIITKNNTDWKNYNESLDKFKRLEQATHIRKLNADTTAQLEIREREYRTLENIITKYDLHQVLQNKYEQLLQTDDIKKKVDAIEGKLAKIEGQLENYEEENRTLIQQLDRATNLRDIRVYIEKLETEHKVYKRYDQCIDMKKGIPYRILRNACADLQNYINDVLNTITTFTIILNFDAKRFHIDIIEGEKTMSAKQGSGFQKFVIDMSLRLALIRNHPYLPEFFIIDEGFGCMDAEHLANTKEFLEKLVVQHFVIIISHIESLNNLVNTISINHNAGVSKILVGEIPELPITEEESDDEDGGDDADIDPALMNCFSDDGDGTTCTVCNKTFKSAKKNIKIRHINSKVHKNKLRIVLQGTGKKKITKI